MVLLWSRFYIHDLLLLSCLRLLVSRPCKPDAIKDNNRQRYWLASIDSKAETIEEITASNIYYTGTTRNRRIMQITGQFRCPTGTAVIPIPGSRCQ